MKVFVQPTILTHDPETKSKPLKNAQCPHCYTGFIVKTNTGEYVCRNCFTEVIIPIFNPNSSTITDT